MAGYSATPTTESRAVLCLLTLVIVLGAIFFSVYGLARRPAPTIVSIPLPSPCFNHSCDLNSTTCVQGRCLCLPGFTTNDTDALFCEDIDECLNATIAASCLECNNTVGSYLCLEHCPVGEVQVAEQCLDEVAFCFSLNLTACDSGFIWNGTACESESVLCHSVNETTCVCPPGYSVDLVINSCSCHDMNECTAGTHTCDSGTSSCANTPGSYVCNCLVDYISAFANECVNETAFCLNITGPCPACPDGFQRHNGSCIDVNECTGGTHTCDGATSTCVNTAGSFSCSCQTGFITNGSSCVNETVLCASFLDVNCTCPPGYTLDQTLTACGCIDINECTLGTHTCDGTTSSCTNTVGSFICPCLVGFMVSDTPDVCVDENECTSCSHNCDANSTTCSNTVGSFTCSCRTGYAGLMGGGTTCTDVDECLTDDGGCDNGTTVCSNTPGSFVCDCRMGYTRATTFSCTDINECAEENACGYCTRCTNTPGSFSCDAPANTDFFITTFTPGNNIYTVPAGVGVLRITAIAGGGGGGSSAYPVYNNTAHQTQIHAAMIAGGGGGGSGESLDRLLAVTAGEIFNVTVGSGGTGGDCEHSLTGLGNGGAGGATTIQRLSTNDIFLLAPGQGGTCGNGSVGGNGGAGEYAGGGGGGLTGGLPGLGTIANGTEGCHTNSSCGNPFASCFDNGATNYSFAWSGGNGGGCCQVQQQEGSNACGQYFGSGGSGVTANEYVTRNFSGGGGGGGGGAVKGTGAARIDNVGGFPQNENPTDPGFSIPQDAGDGGAGGTAFPVTTSNIQTFGLDEAFAGSVCYGTAGLDGVAIFVYCKLTQQNGAPISCATGFVSDGMGGCIDVDECATGNGGGCDNTTTVCSNTPGSFVCNCKTGYSRLNAFTCQDVDECDDPSLNVCTQGAICENTPGSYTCICFNNQVIINAASGVINFTVPSGVTKLGLIATAGGGGGAACSYPVVPYPGVGNITGGGGGGSGYTTSVILDVTPGEVFRVLAGAGGSGGVIHYLDMSQADGGSGGMTWVYRYSTHTNITLVGGSGGTAGTESCAGNGGAGYVGGGGGGGGSDPSCGLGGTGVIANGTNGCRSGSGCSNPYAQCGQPPLPAGYSNTTFAYTGGNGGACCSSQFFFSCFPFYSSGGNGLEDTHNAGGDYLLGGGGGGGSNQGGGGLGGRWLEFNFLTSGDFARGGATGGTSTVPFTHTAGGLSYPAFMPGDGGGGAKGNAVLDTGSSYDTSEISGLEGSGELKGAWGLPGQVIFRF